MALTLEPNDENATHLNQAKAYARQADLALMAVFAAACVSDAAVYRYLATARVLAQLSIAQSQIHVAQRARYR